MSMVYDGRRVETLESTDIDTKSIILFRGGNQNVHDNSQSVNINDKV